MNIKKIISLILAIVICALAVAGCSQETNSSDSGSSDNTSANASNNSSSTGSNDNSSNTNSENSGDNMDTTQTLFYHDVDGSLNVSDLDSAVDRHTADKIVTYKKLANEDLKLCYYFPKNYDKNSKYPVFMIIHGGGWASRNMMEDQTEWSGDYLGYLARYYADKGFLSVVTTYGLLKATDIQNEERQLIDLYTDCQDAMNYVADHAKEYGADLTNVTLLGESAGGHLAAGMATNSYSENRLPLRTAILVNPITNLYFDKWGNGTPEFSTRKPLVGMNKEEISMAMSPLHNISDKTPNVLLIHGSVDSVVNISHSTKFNDRMADLNKKCELHVINGANHAFLLREYYFDPTHTRMGVKIIDDYFAKYNIAP